jgi:hypothetical protein
MNLKHLEQTGWCGGADHEWSRRAFLKSAGLAGITWLTPLSQLLAVEAERNKGRRPRSLIVLWMAGAPSQLETFDPHPNSPIAYGTKAINTSLKGVQIAAGLEQTAGILSDVSLIRSMVSKEGDHERAAYNMKTGYRPNPTVVHPAIGAIITHELPSPAVEIPTHISILPDQWPARGGYFGASFDAFQVGDPAQKIADVTAQVPQPRQDQRLKNLSVVEGTFAKGRPRNLDTDKTLHQFTTQKALQMMTSSQVKAFDVSQTPESERKAYGDTAFGRGCLAAVRLVEAGVRCVEVTLSGWDTHTNNHEGQAKQVQILDAALAATIGDLKKRDLLDDTIVICGGEFGRTPKLNPLDGRDHWPKGFSMLVTGGNIRRGQVIGETDPKGEKEEPVRPVRVEDLHTTILTALGINAEKEITTPIGRPIALSEGRVVKELLD